MKAIVTNSISKVYRSSIETKIGLHDLNMKINKNQFTALVGPNGAGKTTIIKIISTLFKPTTGDVHIFGKNIRDNTSEIRKIIGYTGQETSTDTFATTLENMLHQASIYGLSVIEAKARAKELLELFGLTNQHKLEVRRLSGGQRRRLDIAKSLVHEPKLLILDEPTVNLDPESRHRLWNILLEIRKKRDLTLLFTTHYLDEADIYADNIVFIDKGRCVIEGSPDNLKDSLGGECLVLLFKDGACAMKAVESLRETDAFKTAIVAGKRVVTASATVEHIQAILAFLSEKSQSPRSITLSRPSLDDVYIRLTGSSFEQVDIEGQKSKNLRQEWSW